jgi:hypothetical protein
MASYARSKKSKAAVGVKTAPRHAKIVTPTRKK